MAYNILTISSRTEVQNVHTLEYRGNYLNIIVIAENTMEKVPYSSVYIMLPKEFEAFISLYRAFLQHEKSII